MLLKASKLMPSNGHLSPSEILAAASSILRTHGFIEGKTVQLSGIDPGSHRLFEDSYSVVAVVAFSNWHDLVRSWSDAQTAFVELISDNVSSEESKSWDGYLVLLTSSVVPEGDHALIDRIRYDTTRVRKLISTGEQLREVSDIEDALLPLLPLFDVPVFDVPEALSPEAVLNRLPTLLKGPELSEDVIKAVVDAFLAHEPLIESLHKIAGGK